MAGRNVAPLPAGIPCPVRGGGLLMWFKGAKSPLVQWEAKQVSSVSICLIHGFLGGVGWILVGVEPHRAKAAANVSGLGGGGGRW